jgi:hypothetical protein
MDDLVRFREMLYVEIFLASAPLLSRRKSKFHLFDYAFCGKLLSLSRLDASQAQSIFSDVFFPFFGLLLSLIFHWLIEFFF